MKCIIIGGDAAGMSAAMQIVRNRRDVAITVFEQGDYYSYSQCGLPYYVGGDVAKRDNLIARPRQVFEEKYGIKATIRHQVISVDPTAQTVLVCNLDTGEKFEEHYDFLLAASGARPKRLACPGADLPGVFHLKTIDDAEAIRDWLPDSENVIIVGGGYVGLEAAESFRRLGKQVRIIQKGPQLAGNFDADMAEIVTQEALRNGVSVNLSENVREIRGTSRVKEVVTESDSHAADLVLVSIGIEPNTDYISSVDKLANGAIIVNEYMETSLPGIYAAGDCASHYHRVKKRQDYVPLGTTANKQGVTAGLAISGLNRPFAGIVGTSILRFFDLGLARTGLTMAEAKDMGRAAAHITLETRSAAGYFPASQPITIRLVYDAADRRLLGGQAIGVQGVDKRIDVLATALHAELTIDQVLDLDLAYSPPYNSVWDPIQQAARRVQRSSN